MRNSNPSISVVIPLYNKAEHIKRAINSVLAQTFKDLEIIVVDDGSTDNSGSKVKDYEDPRVRLIEQRNAGPNAARNRAIHAARSDLIAFLDADDEWTPTHLETIRSLHAEYPESGVYAANFMWVLPDGGKKLPVFDGLAPDCGDCIIENYFAVSRTTSILTCSSVAISRKVLEEVGGFPETEFVKQAHALWIKIALNYKIAYSSRVGLIYRLDANNRWDAHIQKIKTKLSDCDTLLVSLLDEAIRENNYRNRSVPIEDIIRYRKKALYWRCSDLIRIGNTRNAWKASLRCLFTREYGLRTLKVLLVSLMTGQK